MYVCDVVSVVCYICSGEVWNVYQCFGAMWCACGMLQRVMCAVCSVTACSLFFDFMIIIRPV